MRQGSDLDVFLKSDTAWPKIRALSIVNICGDTNEDSSDEDENSSFKTNITCGDDINFVLIGFVASGTTSRGVDKSCSIAYVMDLEFRVWYSYYFDQVEIRSAAYISRVLEKESHCISYLSYVNKNELDLGNISDTCEQNFKDFSEKNVGLLADFTTVGEAVGGEIFLPLRNVTTDFCSDNQLFIRKYCAHGSCRKEQQKLGNIMPSHYLGRVPDSKEARVFYNFCATRSCKGEVQSHSLDDSDSELDENERARQELRDLLSNNVGKVIVRKRKRSDNED